MEDAPRSPCRIMRMRIIIIVIFIMIIIISFKSLPDHYRYARALATDAQPSEN